MAEEVDDQCFGHSPRVIPSESRWDASPNAGTPGVFPLASPHGLPVLTGTGEDESGEMELPLWQPHAAQALLTLRTSAMRPMRSSQGKGTSHHSSQSALQTRLEDSVRQRVLRGTSLASVLSGCGRHLRADQLAGTSFTAEEAEVLYATSQPEETLDDFLSHCWRDSGIAKTIALLVHYNGTAALALALTTGVTLMALRLLNLLPTVQLKDEYQHGVDSLYAPWSLGCGTAMLVSTLLLKQHVCSGWQRRSIFFDKLCVHQADAELKALAIRSFPGFIATSKRMVILWTPAYFSRLWCTLEVAALVTISQERAALERSTGASAEELELVLLPSALAVLSVQVAAVCALGFAMNAILTVFRVLRSVRVLGGPVVITSFLPLVVHTMRVYSRDKAFLLHQLGNFCVHKADCYDQADRRLIYKTLKEWFCDVDAFSQHVRIVVKEHVQKSISSRTPGAWQMVALSVTPLFCNQLDYLPVYFEHGGRTALLRILKAVAFPLQFLIALKGTLYISSISAERRSSTLVDVAFSTLLALGAAAVFVISFLSFELAGHSPSLVVAVLPAVVTFGVFMLLLVLEFQPRCGAPRPQGVSTLEMTS